MITYTMTNRDKIIFTYVKRNRELVRIESSNEYIDTLSSMYSKLVAIRTDLSYKIKYRDEITLKELRENLDRLLKNRSHNRLFKHMVGYMLKIELGKNKNNPHVHLLIFLNGQKANPLASTWYSEQIGKYWKKIITKGKGCYDNCHKRCYMKNYLGLLDEEKIIALKSSTIPYFSKDFEVLKDEDGKILVTVRKGKIIKNRE